MRVFLPPQAWSAWSGTRWSACSGLWIRALTQGVSLKVMPVLLAARVAIVRGGYRVVRDDERVVRTCGGFAASLLWYVITTCSCQFQMLTSQQGHRQIDFYQASPPFVWSCSSPGMARTSLGRSTHRLAGRAEKRSPLRARGTCASSTVLAPFRSNLPPRPLATRSCQTIPSADCGRFKRSKHCRASRSGEPPPPSARHQHPTLMSSRLLLPFATPTLANHTLAYMCAMSIEPMTQP